MTIIEKQSLRKKKAILYLIKRGEYSLGYALLKVEEMYDSGKLTESDYDEVADYIEDLLNKAEEVVEEPTIEEPAIEEPAIEEPAIEEPTIEEPIENVEEVDENETTE